MEAVFNGLNKNLTFEDNIQAFTKSLEFKTDAAYSSGTWNVIEVAIPDVFKARVSGVLVLQALPKDMSLITNMSGTYVGWQEDNRSVKILWISGLEDSTTYTFNFLVI